MNSGFKKEQRKLTDRRQRDGGNGCLRYDQKLLAGRFEKRGIIGLLFATRNGGRRTRNEEK